MAGYVKVDRLPKDYKILWTSDWHCGSKAFHMEAAKEICARVKNEKRTYFGHGGDFIEGKKVDSRHFQPDALDSSKLTIGKQFDFIKELLRPIKKKILCCGYGNHDIYLMRDDDILRRIMGELGIEDRLGGYQSWLTVNNKFRVFCYHGFRSIPKGAKDPIQREANQRAWLKRQLEPLAGDSHVMLMGHVHHLLIQPPIEQNTLLSAEDNLRRHSFVVPEHAMQGPHGPVHYVPPESRWYAITGTLRRGGGLDWIDYSEIAGYPPPEIGCIEIIVENNVCVDIKKIKF